MMSSIRNLMMSFRRLLRILDWVMRRLKIRERVVSQR
ncbi:hypothetical protein TELCIR_23846 [Teladorsagia circumcincta]|uniref:Uncharacterized protein n=1 Tax=Teladorsagia circumcincta TaxID=45464 RepID=A0A2G9T9X3_TELCI|nr:hypothetical protein TELCIR_23846 [Teladorsagia circumcincta]